MQHPCAQRLAGGAGVQRFQNEKPNGAGEGRAIGTQAKIAAMHGATGGAQLAAAGVLERFTRLEPGLVAYDAQGGPYAARCWWLLRWLGHEDAAVLDGGIAAWRKAGGAVTAALPAVPPATPYPLHAAAMPTLDADALRAALGRVRLVDARASERFRGEVEPLDAAAGHIPGARNRFFKDNLGADGCFKSAAQLRAEWAPLAAGGSLVHSCGSGVTACHNLLAVAHAGLGEGTLYPGSWSEWSSDPARPQAAGA